MTPRIKVPHGKRLALMIQAGRRVLRNLGSPKGMKPHSSKVVRRRTISATSFSVADLGDISALTVNLKRDDGAIVYLNGTEVARDGLAAGTIGAGDLQSNASDDGNNFHPFTVDASLLLAGDATPTTEALIARKADWSYLDDGTDQGTGWTASDFDDSGWSTGAAELGFTEGDENTLITSGHVTYYFRHTFTVADISDITALCMKTQRDDGCVVYLNGTEVARSINMGDGVITFQTTSGDAMSESTSFMYDVALDGLVAGENVVAVSKSIKAARVART